jgi:hypothetical protein
VEALVYNLAGCPTGLPLLPNPDGSNKRVHYIVAWETVVSEKNISSLPLGYTVSPMHTRQHQTLRRI